MRTKKVISLFILLVIAIGWYLFYPILIELGHEFGLKTIIISWLILSFGPFLFVTWPLVIEKMVELRQDSLAGFFVALKDIGAKQFIIMATFCFMACPPSFCLFTGVYR